ncbi:hypothetical protein [Micromonospora sp. NPDC004551]|uniref:hypothetical protein n=1 Tax=Micromonospora sp. NPDC004551 TaxID=3154284 RepID=UPI0033B4D481
MQPLTAPPRDGLTAAQITTLLRDAPGLEVAAGCELLDMNLTVLDDLSDVLDSGSVSRNAYAELHGSAQLVIERELDWGRALVRPYMLVSSPTTTARFNLGAYFTSTPKSALGTIALFDVTGYDILDVLNTPVGEVYAVAKGASYLATVETMLRDQGVTQYLIDQDRADAVLPSPRVWPMDTATTWLTVINDLLGSIGYAGIWSDWDGRMRVQPYLAPSSRASEWAYDVEPETAMVSPERLVELDLYRAPNRWVFWRSNNLDGPAPVEGNGVYTVVNTTAGPTSVQARGGRVITKPVALDVADHKALVVAGRKTVEADLRSPAKVTLMTSPNPLHWHFDRVTMRDPAAYPMAEMLVTSWSLPLDGGDMRHEWSQVLYELYTKLEAAASDDQ